MREQFTVQHTVIVECLAEGGRKFLLLRVAVNEEKDDGLEKVLVSVVAVLLCERREDRLVGAPIFHDVAVGSKDATQADVELVLGRDIQSELDLTSFLQDRIGSCPAFSLLLTHEVLHVLARSDYTGNTT